jgi:hypothetical protein
MKKALDPQDWKALLRLGDPARELDAGKAERVRRAMTAAAAVRGPEPAPGARLRWDLRLALATASVAACALALVVGLGREAPVPRAPQAPQSPTPRRVQIDFATPGGTRIVWTLMREEPGPGLKTRRGR